MKVYTHGKSGIVTLKKKLNLETGIYPQLSLKAKKRRYMESSEKRWILGVKSCIG